MKSAVITGPTGTIGIALCKYLIGNGIEVYAVCRPNSSRISSLPCSEKIHVISCDASCYSKLPEMIHEKIDVFYHLAWAKTTGIGRNDMPAQIDNIRYTIDAVRAASKLGCTLFLGAGSQAEYGRVEGLLSPTTPCFPENGYGMAKLCAGEMSRIECERLGLNHIWMRVLSVYGPGQDTNSMLSGTIVKLLSGEIPSLTAGEQKWDYLYSEDAAEAFYLAATRGKNGKIYTLGGGQAIPLRKYVEILRDLINPSLTLGFGDIPYAEKQVMHLEADISLLANDTGFIPKTKFENGIKKTIEWVRNEVK